MSKSKGWICLHRSLLDNFLWKDKPFSKGQAWIDLLLLANHADVKSIQNGKIIVFKRGTVNRSKLSLAERWGWSRKKVDRFLRVLEMDGMLTENATTHGTTLTIVNYGFYNDMGTTDATTDAQPTPQPMHTNNNVNNVNKYKRGARPPKEKVGVNYGQGGDKCKPFNIEDYVQTE